MTQWKITFVIGIILFSMGLPLLIVGYVSAGEDALAMIIPGWILISVGVFVAIHLNHNLIQRYSNTL